MFDLFLYSYPEYLFWLFSVRIQRHLWSELVQAARLEWRLRHRITCACGWTVGGMFMVDTARRAGVDPAAADMDCAVAVLPYGKRKSSIR